tara:strand:+ start:312 stop:887 length:576 start_codon:yes stop_codon:yes gene_type:complete
VYAFEPQQPMFQLMCANLALNGHLNTRAWNCAVSDEPGTLYIPPSNYQRSYNFVGIAMNGEAGAGYSVDAVTLDDKIDVEGIELNVFKGASRLIETFPRVIYAENKIREKSPVLLQWLMDIGYRAYWHLPFMFTRDNFYGLEQNPFTDPAGRLILSVNFLAAPSSLTVERWDMTEITDVNNWWKNDGSSYR